MSMHNRLTMLTKLSTLVGVAGASILLSLPALSQETTGSEVELSPEGLEILCERFPLNSRCSGSTGPSALPGSSSTDDSLQSPPSGSSPSLDPSFGTPGGTPGTTDDPGLTAPTSPEGSAPGNLPTPGGSSPGSGSTSPGRTGAPGSAAPRSIAPEQTKSEAIAPATLTAQTTGNETTPAPSAGAEQIAPSAPANTERPAPSTPTASVSQEELQQFANVIPQLQEIEQAAEQQFSSALEEAGMSQQRFGELYRAQRAPGTQPSSSATEEEQQTFNQIVSEIQTIGQQVQSQKVQVLQSEGLEPNRFNQILAAVQQDPALQQQVQQLLNN